MKVNDSTIQEFIKSAVEAYNEESILRDMATVEMFDKEKHGNIDFYQIGQRINVPKDIFSESSGVIAPTFEREIARSIYKGERDFILENIQNDSSEDSCVENIGFEILDFEEFHDGIKKVENPTHLFIPSYDMIRNALFSWVEEGLLEFYKSNKATIKGKSVSVHWIPKESNFNSIFITNRDNINIVQKTSGQASDPDKMDIIRRYDYLDKNSRFMLYFGNDPKYESEFDFLYRVLLSTPHLENGAAVILQPSNLEERYPVRQNDVD